MNKVIPDKTDVNYCITKISKMYFEVLETAHCRLLF